MLKRKRDKLTTAQYPELAEQSHVKEVQMEQRLKKVESGELRVKRMLDAQSRKGAEGALPSAKLLKPQSSIKSPSTKTPQSNKRLVAKDGLGYLNDHPFDGAPDRATQQYAEMHPEALAVRIQTTQI